MKKTIKIIAVLALVCTCLVPVNVFALDTISETPQELENNISMNENKPTKEEATVEATTNGQEVVGKELTEVKEKSETSQVEEKPIAKKSASVTEEVGKTLLTYGISYDGVNYVEYSLDGDGYSDNFERGNIVVDFTKKFLYFKVNTYKLVANLNGGIVYNLEPEQTRLSFSTDLGIFSVENNNGVYKIPTILLNQKRDEYTSISLEAQKGIIPTGGLASLRFGTSEVDGPAVAIKVEKGSFKNTDGTLFFHIINDKHAVVEKEIPTEYSLINIFENGAIDKDGNYNLVPSKIQIYSYSTVFNFDYNAIDKTYTLASLNGNVEPFTKYINQVFTKTAPIAVLNGIPYGSLDGVMKDVKAGDTLTIKLQEDSTLTEQIVIPEGANIILDMNGKKISYFKTGTRPLRNNGNLEIKGNGKFLVENEGSFGILDNYGDLTIQNGIFECNGNGDGALIKNRPAGNIIINNIDMRSTSNGNAGNADIFSDGDLVIKNGDFLSNSGANGVYAIISTGNIEIFNANVTANKGALALTGGKYKIHNGTYKAKNYYAAYIAGEYYDVDGTIYGGKFQSEEHYAALVGNPTEDDGGKMLPATVTIEGGTFISGTESKYSIFEDKYLGKIKVQGGTYNKDVNPTYFSEGYTSVKNVNGMYDVGLKATSIELSLKQVTLKEDSSTTLKAIIKPTNAIDTAITWKSSNSAVASVDKNGIVKAIKEGNTIITGKTASGLQATCMVKVFKETKVDIPKIDEDKPVDTIVAGVNDPKAMDIINNILNEIVNGRNDKFMNASTADKVKEAIANNEEIVTSIVANTIAKENVDSVTANLVEHKIQDMMTSSNTEIKLAQYLDINLLIKANNKVLGNITGLEEPITFTIMLPEGLNQSGRAFYIIRTHEGVAEKLNVQLSGNALTFETEQFSTFALVYEDSKDVVVKTHTVTFLDKDENILKIESVEDGKGATAPTPPSVKGYKFVKWDTSFASVSGNLTIKAIYEKVATISTETSEENPKTGDTSSTELYYAFALLGLVSMCIIIFERKRKA